MLVLSRKQDQQIVIGDDVTITILKIRGNTVRLGIEAPREIPVVRGELSSLEQMKEVTLEFKSHAGTQLQPGNSLRVVPTATQGRTANSVGGHQTRTTAAGGALGNHDQNVKGRPRAVHAPSSGLAGLARLREIVSQLGKP